MKCVIIGTGNVATVLAKLIFKNGHTLLQVAGRNEAAARHLANGLQADYTTGFKNVDDTADMYIIAVSDHAVEEVVAQLQLPEDKMVVHTTGSLSVNILKKLSNNYGVLYPLQSIRKEMHHIPEIPFFVDANNEAARQALKTFAQSLSPLVSDTSDEERVKLHVAAVLVSNFTNYLFTVAEDLCTKENIDFEFLLPLIRETVSRLNDYSPAETMTGPAFRADHNTINRHLEILKNYPEEKEIYQFLTSKIMERFPKH